MLVERIYWVLFGQMWISSSKRKAEKINHRMPW